MSGFLRKDSFRIPLRFIERQDEPLHLKAVDKGRDLFENLLPEKSIATLSGFNPTYCRVGSARYALTRHTSAVGGELRTNDKSH